MLRLAQALLLLAPAAAHAQEAVHCCDDGAITAAVERVLRFTEALADDPRQAPSQLHALVRTLRVPDSLPAADREALIALRDAADAHKNRPVADALDALPTLTRWATFLVLRHEGGELTVAEAWCDGERTWLQRDLEQIHSPYPGCGSWR